MNRPVQVYVLDLGPERVDEYLEFFDKDAFVDFPEWSVVIADSMILREKVGIPPPRQLLSIERIEPSALPRARLMACWLLSAEEWSAGATHKHGQTFETCEDIRLSWIIRQNQLAQ